MNAKKQIDAVSERKLKEVVQRIVATVDPEKVILFGSRARGDHRSDSDVDLLIIQPSTRPRYLRSAPIRRAIAGIIPSKDIVVYTPAEVEEWRNVPNAFVTMVIAQGKVLYEKKQG